VNPEPAAGAALLGDFIDRGPQIRQVLAIVWPMIHEGAAGRRPVAERLRSEESRDNPLK
jgi:hypothetical protein